MSTIKSEVLDLETLMNRVAAHKVCQQTSGTTGGDLQTVARSTSLVLEPQQKTVSGEAAGLHPVKKIRIRECGDLRRWWDDEEQSSDDSCECA